MSLHTVKWLQVLLTLIVLFAPFNSFKSCYQSLIVLFANVKCFPVKKMIKQFYLTAIDRLSILWKSDLTDKLKRSFFQAAVVAILLYGCTTWTLTKRLEEKLDGNYTRMLRTILNKSRRQHPTRHHLYGPLPPITKTIQARRTRHAGRAHKWCTPMDLRILPSKSRTTSSNLHTAAIWGYGM